MLIRIKQIRQGGTTVTTGKDHARQYHFKPVDSRKPDEDHVCDVTNQDDIATLLAIKEGYEVHPSEIRSQAKPTTLRETTAAGNGNDGGNIGSAETALTKAELIDAVAKKTGKKPHPSTSVAKLQILLDAK